MFNFRLLMFTVLSCLTLNTYAQHDWDGVDIPATLPAGMKWELDPVSDGFNYESSSSNRGEEFDSRWNELYINGFSGPSATSYHKDHVWSTGGNLVIHAAKDNQNIIYTGCISSKASFSYPMFMEAKVKQPSCMLAANIWMISQDETEELDMLESYPNVQEDGGWLDQRIHLSHHTFIREPFQDYQPRDEHGVKGTWYWEKDRTSWHDDWLRIGVYWINPHHVEYYINGKWVRTMKSHEHSFLNEEGEVETYYTEFDALDKFGYTEETGLSKPQHIIINMEQQDWLTALNVWPTDEDLDDANGRNTYLVDWVRLYNVIPETGVVPVEEVTISEIEIELQPGETFDLDHIILPVNATKQAVSWTTSNSMIATVNGEGVVRAISNGIVTADVITQDGSFVASCKVEVVGDVIPNPVVDISLPVSSLDMTVGEDVILTPTFTPVNATDQRVLWESTDPSVAFVGANGLIAALKEGTATVSVVSQDGGQTDHVAVTVMALEIDTVFVTSVAVDQEVVTISESEEISLNAVVLPSDATNKAVIWSSSDVGIASVSSTGKVIGIAEGVVIITARSIDGGFTATSSVTIEESVCVPSPATVNITSSIDNGLVGSCIQITTETLGETCDGAVIDQAVTFTSSNLDVARVDSNGQVCFEGEGTSIISIESVNGGDGTTLLVTGLNVDIPSNNILIEAEDFITTGGPFDGFEVYDINGVTAINYNQTGDWAEYNVTGNGSYEIEYFIGTAVTGAAIKLYVDGNEIGIDAVVNNGDWNTFVALKSNQTITLNGTHTIRIEGAGTNTWQWNMDYFTLSTINVEEVPVSNVTLDQSVISVNIGSNYTLNATVSPSTATDKTVTWSSSNTTIATVSNGVINAISEGVTTISVLTNDGDFVAEAVVTVIGNQEVSNITVEAELFTVTGGVTNDAAWGGPGNGVNATSTNINWVNTQDWAEYSVTVPTSGLYTIEYIVSTPQDNAQITLEIDGHSNIVDIPNNGEWDSYSSIVGGTINLSAGIHTLRLTASGTNEWQWNLDKVIFTPELSSARVLSTTNLLETEVKLYPIPANDNLNIVGLPNGNYEVSIFNISGLIVASEQVKSTTTKAVIDVSTLGAGIYIINIIGEGVTIRRKISIK
ncbi:Ig-like domain-containing protein [Flammeovirga kamogawensis]|uniref:Ig-like domain-containing protein n=1 Tax=Flammeovirga kamogawensis TaxID=373891 RepID=A0ABX8GRT4_9BACT|nr:Ig-like domain-containing protein [Flammeovirga kamogawensis]MBB6461396.1 uncharacterized protein YjdB [Flammeovirga kamogawensis]QWG06295.1 Ig-like domain-containing protein [Flammeovirga kamogawensis]TRX68124.1 carbohydrate-binding protein [Flammeovirga kamogawensis]